MEVKRPTTLDEQIEKLKERGCIIGDEGYAKQVLGQINYYRLTAYFPDNWKTLLMNDP